jgi:putative ATP-binding cassette transporter
MRLQIKWRGWLTKRLIGYWLADRRFYQMSVVENEGSNPEFRITDDTRLATEPIVDFAIGLAAAVLTAAAFVGILWSVGGTIPIPVGGGISIPGYMVIAAFAYSGVASISTLIISRTLVHRVAEKNEGEAELRYELTRVRESAETIALLGGDAEEEKQLGVTVNAFAGSMGQGRHPAGAAHLDHQRQFGFRTDCSAAARRAEISVGNADPRRIDAARLGFRAGASRLELAR